MHINYMKKYLLFLVFFAQNAVAQTSEPNLKWGKPTDAELKMTEYADSLKIALIPLQVFNTM